MNKFFISCISLLLLLSIASPTILFAADTGPFNLIVCEGPNCGFGDLITLFYRGINALVAIATVVTVIALIAMGVKLMTAGGKPGELTEIKKRAKWIIIGYVCIIAAWLFVYTILKALVNKDFILLGN